MTSVRDLADRMQRRWLEENPFTATMYGIAGYDDLVPDESEDGAVLDHGSLPMPALARSITHWLDQAG